VNSQSDADWAAFSASQAAETDYDDHARPVLGKRVAGGTTYALTQTKYDALGRAECVVQRMDSADFASTLPDACTLTTPAGAFGPDRISKSFYDAAGRVHQVKTAFGVTGEVADEVTRTFTANGQVETVTDAENNKTTYEYDGHDRLVKTRFPDPAKGAGTSSTSDYEQPTYESLAGGARTSGLVTAFRNRGNQTAGFGYDSLGRQVSKDLPGTEPDVAYGYDLVGRLTSASQPGSAFTFTYDALGRMLNEAGPRGTVSSDFDLAGRRTRIVYPDGFFVDQDHLVTGEIWKIRENGATSGIGVLATFAYDDLGRRTSLARGNGTVTSYGYDAVSRLTSLGQDLGGTAYDLTLGFAYNPASQIASNTRSNDAYAWLGHGGGTTNSSVNGLNQIAVHGGASVGHDPKGNLTSDPTIGKSYGYSSENLLTSVGLSSGHVGTITYDPLMRLAESGVNSRTKPVHDGGQRIFEYYGTGNEPGARFVNAPASTSRCSNIRAPASPPAAGSTPTSAARSSPAPTIRATSPTSTRSTSRA
jgi:YD repeat-containing protein